MSASRTSSGNSTRGFCGLIADEADLSHAVGVGAAVLAAELVDVLLVLLRRELDQEITRIHLEYGWKQLVIIDVIGQWTE